MGKNGKFINPTDQARKEARRKELKKNKKQRAIVRQAVIKQKDPKHLITEMEALDKMEYDPDNPPPYNVKVIQDKRKKLKESFQKIQQYYVREEPKMASELKQMELDYERRRTVMAEHWESVMQAQRVKLDDIPLPSEEPPPVTSIPLPSDTGDELNIPMPPSESQPSSAVTISAPAVISAPPKSILKGPLPSGRTSKFDQPPTATGGDADGKKSKKTPPGPPPSSPPSLSEFECDDDEFELGLSLKDEYKPQEKPKKIRFNTEEHSESTVSDLKEEATKATASKHTSILQPAPPPPPLPPVIPHPYALHPSLIAAPPPPPPPPTTGASSMASSAYGQRTGAMIPPPTSFHSTTNRMMTPQQQQHSQYTNKSHQPPSSSYYQQPPSSSSSSAAASSSSASASSSSQSAQSTTIEAKPVLRNKLAEVVRFVPTSVAIRRDAKKPGAGPNQSSASPYSSAQQPTSVRSGPYDYMSQQQKMYASANPLKAAYEMPTATVYDPRQLQQQQLQKPKQADSTYESFMKEIGKLL